MAYVPEWAFAAGRADITTAMYREASSLWQQSDRTVHTVTLWANDPDAPAPLTGNDLIRCDAAFVVAEHRHTGAGQSLFASAMKWAVEAGLKRLAVDYESANPEASRFWPAVGCRAVMHGVARRLAE